ncbi:MAG TPA: FGGY-family carbohydrate kinase, partial [Gemmatimonadales bacterium]|nr:FGGY-family carbohydrate kinase [Gemmatimonadales bacterium]
PRCLMPEIVPSSGVVGEARPEHLGFALPIAGLAGDQQAALFGQACTRRGLAKNTYGTGAFLLVHAGDAVPEPGAGLLATMACGPKGEPAYAVEGSVFVAGAAVQWMRDGLGLIVSAAETQTLAQSVPDTGGVVFVPAFVGLGTPHWEPEARGTITGLTRGTTKAHLVRAALEAMAFGTADLLTAIQAGSGVEVPVLRVDGGASANDFLMQHQADLLGFPVERPTVLETTALGAAGLAGIATGIWQTMDEVLAAEGIRRFAPAMTTADRRERIAEWERAVAAALTWARWRPSR